MHTVPSEPLNPKVISIAGSPMKLLVTWDPPAEQNGIILLYTIYCYELSIEENRTFSDAEIQSRPDYEQVPGNETLVVLSNFRPYTFYGCLVTANTSVGESNSSFIKFNVTDESGKCYIM